jgi:hypothetical protein
VLPQVALDTGVDLPAHQRIVEQRGADTDRRCTGDDELERVVGIADPALADNGYAVR